MKNRFVVFILLLIPALAFSGCVFMKVNLKEEVQPLEEQVISGAGREKVLLLDISGIISSRERTPLVGGEKKISIVSRVREELDRARKDRNVKAVVIRINSPGGGATASDTLYHEIEKFKRDTGAKVVAHLMDVGTSGAYYAALAADRITAQPTTVTGSIGVIMVRLDATGLMEKVGLQALEISSGERKGMGSPFRPLSSGEKEVFQGVIDSLFARFADTVAEERKLSRDAVKQVADGRIFTSQEAKAAGLIDGIGYLEDALEAAKKEAGIARARVVTYHRPGEYKSTIYSMGLINVNLGEFLEPGMQFLYLWWP
jgi:protease-4